MITLRQILLFIFLFAISIFGVLAQQMKMTFAASGKYFDQNTGKTADDLVRLALDNNAELDAFRKESSAAEQLIRQAGLRANPTLEFNGAKEIGGMGDNSQMIQGGVPLELGGRRTARIRVAQRELEIRQLAVAERERQLAADVRTKFGEGLAAILKLRFMEEMLVNAEQNYSLTASKVDEGRTSPLERNQEVVELNRIRVLRETSESVVEIKMFELRNLVGMKPEDPLKLNGTLEMPVEQLPLLTAAMQQALQKRPDLAGARAVEALAAAKVEQARSEGRVDADLMLGYQRMKSGFPLLGIQEGTGALLPIDSKFHFFTFGLKLMLPVRNRNQGVIAAAQLEEDAARGRREFGELTIRREVASAYARYERTLKAREIYRVGIRDQALSNLSVVRQTYELGSKTLLDYIAEHHRYIDTENGYIDSQLEAFLAKIDILRSTNSPELVNK